MKAQFKRFLDSLSIRTKLLGAIFFLLGSVILFIALTVPSRLSNEYLDSLKEEAKISARLISNSLIPPLDFQAVPEVKEAFKVVRQLRDLEFAAVLDAQGNVVTNLGNSPKSLSHFLSVDGIPTLVGGHLRISERLVNPTGTDLGRLLLQFSLNRYETKKKGYLLISALLGGLVLLVGALVAYVLTFAISRPLAEVTSAVKRVSHARFKGPPVPLKGGDEITELARSFNLMIEDLRAIAAAEQSKAEELRLAYERLAKLDQMKSRFFDNVSHEIRTPLTLILSPLKRLLTFDAQLLPVQVVETLSSMEKNAYLLLRLVNQLLELSRIESGITNLRFELRDIRSFVDQLADAFKAFSSSKGVKLEVRGLVDLPKIYIDSAKLEKVLANLLSNACKFTDSGGSVIVRLALQEQVVVISVKDTGVGISEEDIPKIFERFRQIENQATQKYEGTGIGLALVKELIQLMGATIDVESELGVGTTFTLKLPLGTSHIKDPETIVSLKTKETESTTSELSALTAEVNLRTGRPEGTLADAEKENCKALASETKPLVLVIEDNHDMRSLVKDICLQEFQVIEAEDGESGLALMRSHCPSLVISDVMLPGIDGYEVLRQIRHEASFSSTPVMLLTAMAGSELKLAGLEKGADDYLTKPFEPRELIARARNLVRLKKQEQELSQLARTLQQEIVNQTATLERTRTLRQYLPPEVVKMILEEGRPATVGQERHRISAFRIELSGFSRLIDLLEPEDMVVMLNSYLSAMVELAFAHGATVDKFIRDTVVGFIGAPKSAGPEQDAMTCAKLCLELWHRANDICASWQGLLQELPPTPTVIMASGYAAVGNFGSSNRMEYTAVGGPVDEAAELFTLVKPGQVACSQSTWMLLQNQMERISSKEVHLDNRPQPIKLYYLKIAEGARQPAGHFPQSMIETGPELENANQHQGSEKSSREAEHQKEKTEAMECFPGAETADAPDNNSFHYDANANGRMDVTSNGEKEIRESVQLSQRDWDFINGEQLVKAGQFFADRYKVLGRLGSGGMGTVFLATDHKLGTEVALKVVRRLGEDEDRIQRLRREVKLARLVSHPNVARIFDLDEANGIEFISMEYIRGQSLQLHLKEVGPLQQEDGIHILNQICQGLQAAHLVGIVHRDLKPSNVMIEDGGRIVILDFGIAKWISPQNETGTETKGLKGTPFYMAPEMFEGKMLDHRTDIYSLGVLAYEMFTGKRPFEAETEIGIAYLHTHVTPQDPLTLRSDLSPRVAAVILRCLEKDPRNRFSSVGDILSLLTGFIERSIVNPKGTEDLKVPN